MSDGSRGQHPGIRPRFSPGLQRASTLAHRLQWVGHGAPGDLDTASSRDRALGHCIASPPRAYSWGIVRSQLSWRDGTVRKKGKSALGFSGKVDMNPTLENTLGSLAGTPARMAWRLFWERLREQVVGVRAPRGSGRT
jgi:hypothetical protein